MSDAAPAIVWFRDDLRLMDNPALNAAAASGRPIICVYVFDQESPGLRPLGGAAKWWLHGSLAALDEALQKKGGPLLLMRGRAAERIEWLAAVTKAQAVCWNRRYDKAGRDLDAGLKSALKERGVAAESFNGTLLQEPWTVTNKAGAPFKVFTAYWRTAQQSGEPCQPLPVPKSLRFCDLPEAVTVKSIRLGDMGLEPTAPDWAGGLREAWTRDEAAAEKRLDDFLETGLAGYASRRDRPDLPATSRLSPYLRFGNISPRRIWHAVQTARAAGTTQAQNADIEKFLSEIGWREFCYHLLYHQPDLATRNIQPLFDRMPWRDDPAALRAWRRGSTGYPIVDAGMRELWAAGWMHNRVRMIVASFLTKHLLIDWREGEAWFWDTLVDADPANNPTSWQWVAGSGADAAPYFRVFNPVLQGEKFDPDGAYVRRWVPEIARLPTSIIHKPRKATAKQLAEAQVILGETYPEVIVDHNVARHRALETWRSIRK